MKNSKKKKKFAPCLACVHSNVSADGLLDDEADATVQLARNYAQKVVNLNLNNTSWIGSYFAKHFKVVPVGSVEGYKPRIKNDWVPLWVPAKEEAKAHASGRLSHCTINQHLTRVAWIA